MFLWKANGLVENFGFAILEGNSLSGPHSSPCQQPCFNFFHPSKLEDEFIFLRSGG
jgi:hypothetical protein